MLPQNPCFFQSYFSPASDSYKFQTIYYEFQTYTNQNLQSFFQLPHKKTMPGVPVILSSLCLR